MNQSIASKIEAANRALLVEGKWNALDELFTADYLAHDTDQKIEGYGAIRKFVRELQKGFPDLEVEVEILLKTKDRVAWQRRLRGSHRGSFRGFPATGRRVVWRTWSSADFATGGSRKTG